MFTNPNNCAAVLMIHMVQVSHLPFQFHSMTEIVARIEVEIFILTSAPAADDASIPTPIEGESQG